MRIGMMCEAASDQRTATTLAGRVLGRSVETTCIDPVIDTDPTFTKWTKLNHHPQAWPRHHLNGWRGTQGPLHGQTLAARKALLLFTGKADAVILMLDGDNEADARRDAMERARNESQTIAPDRIVVTVPKPEREVWHIAGFEPQDETERNRLAKARTELGFDPRMKSYDLKHGDDTAKRNAKRVHELLSEGDRAREEVCISDTPLETLRSRGRENGLADFLSDVERLR